MATKSIVVKGRVQGVYFRASAKQLAMNLGLKGNIRNQEDGSVKLHIQGHDKAVASMIDWCKQGPALARVKQVEVEEVPALSASDFDILH